jgi:hypothetical protein
MRKKGQIATVIVISLLVVGFFLSIYITVEEEIPGNAVVVVTTEDKLYHSIHFDHICVSGKTAKTMTLAEAKAQGYHLLSKLGIQVNSRWDKNGNWLW